MAMESSNGSNYTVKDFVNALEHNDLFGAREIMIDEYVSSTTKDFKEFFGAAKQATLKSDAAPNLYQVDGWIGVDDGTVWDTSLIDLYDMGNNPTVGASQDPEIERAGRAVNELIQVNELTVAKSAVKSLMNHAKGLSPEKQAELYKRTETLNESRIYNSFQKHNIPRLQFTLGDTNGDGKKQELLRAKVSLEESSGRKELSIELYPD